MPSNLKQYHNNTLIEVSFRTEQGLPLVVTPYMQVIIEGVMAAAQEKYPVKICHYIFMGNHPHMILVVRNPSDVSNFVGYLKGELAHAINRMAGRRQRTVWKDNFDSPLVLSPRILLERLKYLYLNPTKANLVNTISEYPGCNTFQALMSGKSVIEKQCKRIPRDRITKLPASDLTLEQQQEYANQLLAGPGLMYTLKIEPWAWMDCFPYEAIDREHFKAQLLKELYYEEKKLAEARQAPVLGALALKLQDPLKEYIPQKFGKKMICLSDCIEQRRSYITYFKEQMQRARKVFKQWWAGDLSPKPPPGFFCPGGAVLASTFFPVWPFSQ
jgi:REP element-mobilizing transposase RayT